MAAREDFRQRNEAHVAATVEGRRPDAVDQGWWEKLVVAGIDPELRQRILPRPVPDGRDKCVPALLDAITEFEPAGDVDHRLQARRLALGQCHDRGAACRFAQGDDAVGRDVGALGQRLERGLELLRVALEALRHVGQCAARAFRREGTVRLSEATPDDDSGKPATAGEIAGDRGVVDGAQIAHPHIARRLAVRDQCEWQLARAPIRADDQGFEARCAAFDLDAQESGLLAQHLLCPCRRRGQAEADDKGGQDACHGPRAG